MNLSQEKFAKNYISLMFQVDKNDLGNVLRFCSLFKTDDIKLFNKFKNSSQSVKDLINLYAEIYDLNPQKDIEKIMRIFIQNAINNGVSYHISSLANRSSIFANGLVANTTGIKTEERIDYEKLEQVSTPELFRKLEPFHNDMKEGRIYYSNVPILDVRYGVPEWLQELKINSDFVNFGNEELAKKTVDEILKKYEKKYVTNDRDIYILPYLGRTISESDIKGLLAQFSPKDIIEILYDNVLCGVDEYCTHDVSNSNIISIDMENLNLHFLGKDGKIVTISPYTENKQKNQAEKLQGVIKQNAIKSESFLRDTDIYDIDSEKSTFTGQQAKDENEEHLEQSNGYKELDLSRYICKLKLKLDEIKNAYNKIITVGYTNDKELEKFNAILNQVTEYGYTLKDLATSQEDIRTIMSIIDILEEQQRKIAGIHHKIK